MNEQHLAAAMMSLVILAGVAVLWMAMVSRRKVRELEHRERLAMIERGILPPPETDPGTFERGAGLTQESHSTARMRTAGVLFIAFGLGLMVLIAFAAGEPNVGVGIGGAFAILGIGFVANAMLTARLGPPALPPAPVRADPDRRDPPAHPSP